MVEGAPREISPQERLDNARQEFSRALLDPNLPSGASLISRLSILQTTLFANAQNIHPEAIFAELSSSARLAFNRAGMMQDVPTQDTLLEMHAGFEAARSSFQPAIETPAPQPTRTEDLPSMSRPKGEPATELKEAVSTPVAEKPLKLRLQQLLDILNENDSPTSKETLGERLGVKSTSVPNYIRELRATGVQIETVPGFGYRIPDQASETKSDTSSQ